MASRKASVEGKALIKKRRIELGWNYCDPQLAIAFGKITCPELDWENIGQSDPYREISECSIRRFQGGRPRASHFCDEYKYSGEGVNSPFR